MKQKNKKVNIPKAKKFLLTYRNLQNKVQDYIISLPVEERTDSFTAYSFGRGIRSFKKNGIIGLSEVKMGKSLIVVD